MAHQCLQGKFQTSENVLRAPLSVAECLLAGMKMQSAFWIGLRSPGRKVNIESLCAPRDQPEKEREGEEEREKERERKND